MVGPTPPSTPGSAILSEIRAVPQSALSQMSMSENNMGSGSSLNSSVGDVTSQAGNAEINHAVIWGTTINVNDAMSSFRRFLNEFRLPRENDNFDGMNNNNIVIMHQQQVLLLLLRRRRRLPQRPQQQQKLQHQIMHRISKIMITIIIIIIITIVMKMMD